MLQAVDAMSMERWLLVQDSLLIWKTSRVRPFAKIESDGRVIRRFRNRRWDWGKKARASWQRSPTHLRPAEGTSWTLYLAMTANIAR